MDTYLTLIDLKARVEKLEAQVFPTVLEPLPVPETVPVADPAVEPEPGPIPEMEPDPFTLEPDPEPEPNAHAEGEEA